jgi:peroxiredoxin
MGRLLRGRTAVLALQSDDTAPDFILTTVEGQIVSLSRVFRTGRSVLLVFLRHLG